MKNFPGTVKLITIQDDLTRHTSEFSAHIEQLASTPGLIPLSHLKLTSYEIEYSNQGITIPFMVQFEGELEKNSGLTIFAIDPDTLPSSSRAILNDPAFIPFLGASAMIALTLHYTAAYQEAKEKIPASLHPAAFTLFSERMVWLISSFDALFRTSNITEEEIYSLLADFVEVPHFEAGAGYLLTLIPEIISKARDGSKVPASGSSKTIH